jgi:8-oxo-dGTP pyrophosphatase MutT (NUDIX family)
MDISLKNAKENKLFYFVVTGIIYHPEKKKCLILKRSVKEKAHPGLWGVVGGKMEWDDMLTNPPTKQNHAISDWDQLIDRVLFREALEESGLIVSDMRYIDNVVFLRPDNVPVVCIKCGVKYVSGEVTIDKNGFDDFAWVDVDEVKQYKTIGGIDKEVQKTIQLFSDNP